MRDKQEDGLDNVVLYDYGLLMDPSDQSRYDECLRARLALPEIAGAVRRGLSPRDAARGLGVDPDVAAMAVRSLNPLALSPPGCG